MFCFDTGCCKESSLALWYFARTELLVGSAEQFLLRAIQFHNVIKTAHIVGCSQELLTCWILLATPMKPHVLSARIAYLLGDCRLQAQQGLGRWNGIQWGSKSKGLTLPLSLSLASFPLVSILQV